MRSRGPSRGSLVAAAAAVLGLVVAGCSEHTELTGTSADGAEQPDGSLAAPSSRSAPAPVTPPSGPVATPSREVSLPPGDPGLDAPPAPDPGTAAAVQPLPEEKAPPTVPVRAMLSTADLATTYGGRWERRPGGADDCVVLEGALAERTRSYGGPPAGTVVETVASYGDVRRADAAVLDLRVAAERCGWTGVHDPRVGSAAVTAEDPQGRSLTAVSAEGVLVVLVGQGRVVSGGKWDALVDLAMGSSCPAAVGGCH